MSLQNSRELSGMSVTVNGHEIGVDRVANTCNPIKDFKVLLARGFTGNGIDHIAKTGTSGNVDTYTIYFTDGTTYDYTVTNGGGGGVGWLHGVCSTAAATAAKTVTLDDSTHTLEDGDVLLIEFTNGNTASTPTLAVNSGSALGIYFDGALTNYGGLYTSGAGYLLLKYDETNTRFEVVDTSKPYGAHKVDNTFFIGSTKYNGSQTENYQKCEYDGSNSKGLLFREFTRPFMSNNWVVSGDRIENTYTYSGVEFFDTQLPITAYLDPSRTAAQKTAFARMRNVEVSVNITSGNTVIKLSCDGDVAPTENIPLIIEGWK